VKLNPPAVAREAGLFFCAIDARPGEGFARFERNLNYYHAVAYFMLKMGTYFDKSTLATANYAGWGGARSEIIFHLTLKHASYLPKHKEERGVSRR
jgi:hypothetical protein